MTIIMVIAMILMAVDGGRGDYVGNSNKDNQTKERE